MSKKVKLLEQLLRKTGPLATEPDFAEKVMSLLENGTLADIEADIILGNLLQENLSKPPRKDFGEKVLSAIEKKGEELCFRPLISKKAAMAIFMMTLAMVLLSIFQPVILGNPVHDSLSAHIFEGVVQFLEQVPLTLSAGIVGFALLLMLDYLLKPKTE